MLSLTVEKLDAYKFDGVAQSDNAATQPAVEMGWGKGSPTIGSVDKLWTQVKHPLSFVVPGSQLTFVGRARTPKSLFTS